MTDGIGAIVNAFLSPVWIVWAVVQPFVWLLAPLLAVGALSLYLGWSVAKGGGQFGIIEGYVGTIGAGKTTLAVQHSLSLARARGAVLLSNIPIRCNPDCCNSSAEDYAFKAAVKRRAWAKGAPHCTIEHDTLPMTDMGLDLEALTVRAFALRDAERGLVLLMDEVGVIMPARLWKDFSVALMWVLQQSRKLSCEWVWTAQDPTFVDHQLRSLTSAVHYVRAIPPPSIWRRARGKRPWVMLVSSYTPSNAPRANGEGGKPERRIGRSLRLYNRRWEFSFDTDGVVLPSRHLRGAEALVAAVEGSGDRHVITSGASDWGAGMGGELPPEVEVQGV